MAKKDEPRKSDKAEANRDPITGAPGAHPVGTGLGAAAGGAAAGAAAGTVAGPAGTLAGAVAGAVLGGLAGKAAAEAIDPTVEDAYWEQQYTQEPYYRSGRSFDDYAPAYRTGYTGRVRYSDRRFEDVEGDLEAEYNRSRGNAGLEWDDDAKPAARAAWNRVERTLPRDANRDGR